MKYQNTRQVIKEQIQRATENGKWKKVQILSNLLEKRGSIVSKETIRKPGDFGLDKNIVDAIIEIAYNFKKQSWGIIERGKDVYATSTPGSRYKKKYVIQDYEINMKHDEVRFLCYQDGENPDDLEIEDFRVIGIPFDKFTDIDYEDNSMTSTSEDMYTDKYTFQVKHPDIQEYIVKRISC